MPRFNPNPATASFGFLQYPKGTFRVQLSDPKPFLQVNNKNTPPTTSYGVRIGGKIISSPDVPDFIGKPHPITFYQHSDGGMNYSKGIQAAILGCKTDEEFNQKFGDPNLWTFDTDDLSMGEGWRSLDGKIVDVTYGDMKLDPKDSEMKSGNSQYTIAA